MSSMKQLDLFANEESGAVIDPTGMYRYSLWRVWDPTLPRVLFIMLNPSTADASENDPTIRRCLGFAKSWGFGSLEVVNLFGYRATDPDELKTCADPVGPGNDEHVLLAATRASKIILAWGTKGTLLSRNRKMYALVAQCNPHCLDMSKDGHPKHPLYIAANREPFRYIKEEWIL